MKFSSIQVLFLVLSDGFTKLASHPNDILPPTKKEEKEEKKGDLLPVFLEDPLPSFVIKSRPAILNCSVIHSSKAYFTCNGEALAKSSEHVEKNLVDENGQVVRILSVEISREQVEEYFDVFKCHCDAWSSSGQASSKYATVGTGCK